MKTEDTQTPAADECRLETTVMPHLYEPWKASLKTQKTHNIGIYNRVGEVVASLDVHQCASTATQDRRMREARMMAAAPELLAFARWFLDNRDGPGRQMAQAAVDKAVGAA